MQALTKLAFLDITDKLVNAGQGLSRADVFIKAQISFYAEGFCFGADIVFQPLPPFRIKTICVRKFIQQGFQIAELCRGFRVAQRRRNMAKGQRTYPAFGLSRFARIIDNKRINDRQIACQGFRPAGLRQGNRLARQPFQRAMRPDMNNRIDRTAGLKPQIKRHITMTGHARDIMIVSVPVSRVAAFRLQGHQRVADLNRRKSEHLSADKSIVVDIAPDCLQITLQDLWQTAQGSLIVSNRPGQRHLLQAVFKRLVKRAVKMA